MLTFLFAALFGITSPRAQTNAEYHFQQESLIDGSSYGHPLNTDPVIGTNPVDPASTTYYWPAFNYSTSVSAVSQQSIPGWLTCGDNEITKKDDKKSESIQTNQDSCSLALDFAGYAEVNGILFDSAYDTMQWYIKHCYKTANASSTWGAYQNSWSAVLYYPGGRDSIFNFVLFALGLRNDDEWFCLGVPLLQVKFVTSNGAMDFRACRAIDRFLMDNPRCGWNYDADSTDYSNLLRAQYNLWSDTANSGTFDSTIPTLHDIGLDTLLKFAADAVYPITTSSIILDAKLEGNPTASDGLLWLSIGREAYLHIGVYDLLGRQVANAGYNGVFEQGTREVPLGMSAAPPGTYYVRLQTANNETLTLKLVKE
ncbi:MAG TPA: T9SS type A sorting domain-containing protein [Candidatus Kapabacteria bacterium]|jgi:hypothetical protein